MSLHDKLKEIVAMRAATEQDANDTNQTPHERTVSSAQVAAYDFALTKIAEGIRGLRAEWEKQGKITTLAKTATANGGFDTKWVEGGEQAIQHLLKQLPTNKQLDALLKEAPCSDD